VNIKEQALQRAEYDLEEMKLRKMQLKGIVRLLKNQQESREAKNFLQYLDNEIMMTLKEQRELKRKSLFSVVISFRKSISRCWTKCTDFKSMGKTIAKKEKQMKKSLHNLEAELSKSHQARKRKFRRQVRKMDKALEEILSEIKKHPKRFMKLFAAKKVRIKRYPHPKLSKTDLNKIKTEIKRDIIKEARLARDSGKSFSDIHDTLIKKGYPAPLVQKGLKIIFALYPKKKYRMKKVLFEIKK
jgi:hypothetical protein